MACPVKPVDHGIHELEFIDHLNDEFFMPGGKAKDLGDRPVVPIKD